MSYKPPTLPGGSSGKSGTSTSLDTAKVRKLRHALVTGDSRRAVQQAKKMGVSKQNLKAIQAVASGFDQGNKSFIQKVGSDLQTTLQGLPQGLARTSLGAVKEATAIPRLGIDVAQGDPITLDRLLRAAPVAGQLYATEEAARTGQENSQSPFSSGLGTSLRRTGERIAHPKQAVRDYSQHPLSTLLEDAGNVAIVGAAGAKALRVAGLSDAAAAVERVNAAPSAIANAPFLPVSRTARLANRGIEAGINKAVTSDRLRPMMEHLKMTPEARQTKSLLRTQHETEAATSNRLTKSFRAQEKLLPKVEEQEAMVLVGQGQAETLALAKRTLPEETFQRVVENTVGKDVSPEAINLAIDVAEGRNPELTNRIHDALDVGRPGRVERESGYLARGGTGRVAQTDFAPLPDVVAEKMSPIVKKLEQAQKFTKRAQEVADANRGRLQRAQSEAEFTNVPAVQRPQSGALGPSHFIGEDVSLSRRLGKEETRQQFLDNQAKRAFRREEVLREKLRTTGINAASSIEAAPARLRPVLEVNRAVTSELTGLENSLRAQGLDTSSVAQIADGLPTTLQALEDAGVDFEHFINPRETLRGGAGATKPSLPRTGRMDESRRRTGKGVHDLSIRAQAKATVRRAHQVIAEQSAQEIAQLPFVKKGSDFVTWDGPNNTPRFPTRAELHAQGLEVWAPNTLFETTPQVAADSLIIPKAIHDSFKSYYAPKNWEKVLEKTYDKGTRAFKTIVLPLSPAWNVGNAVTNAFMATFAGGVDPVTLARMIGRSIAEHHRTGEWPGPQRLYESGSTHETLDFLGSERLNKGRIRTAASLPVRAGYKANETIDNIFRSATYLAKKGKGYSDEAALRMSLQALGDFTKMSPFERSTVRRIIPFYAWLRHMAQIAVRMPIEHPMRTAVILALSNEFKDKDAWEAALPNFMQGFIPAGGDNAVSVQNFMPFSNPFAIGQLGSNLNPIIKLGLANLPGSPARGINPLTGRPFTRQPGTGRMSEFGQEQPTAPSILQQLRQIPPQARALDALLGRKDVARYESGQVVQKRGAGGKLHPIPTPQSDLRTWSKYLGVPITSQKQLKEIVDSILLRRITAYKTAHPAKKLGGTSSGGGGGGYQPPTLK